MYGGVESYSKDQNTLMQWAQLTTEDAKTIESLMNEIKKLKEDTYYQSLSTTIIDVKDRQRAMSRRENFILEYEKALEIRNKKFEQELYIAPVVALSQIKIKVKKIISGPAKDLGKAATYFSNISDEGIYGIYLRGTDGNHVLGVRVSNIDASKYSSIQYTWGKDVNLLNRFMDANSIEAQFRTKAALFGFLADYMKLAYNLEKPTLEEILKENFNPARMRYYHTYLIFKYESL
jgi:hypothetical protein